MAPMDPPLDPPLCNGIIQCQNYHTSECVCRHSPPRKCLHNVGSFSEPSPPLPSLATPTSLVRTGVSLPGGLGGGHYWRALVRTFTRDQLHQRVYLCTLHTTLTILFSILCHSHATRTCTYRISIMPKISLRETSFEQHNLKFGGDPNVRHTQYTEVESECLSQVWWWCCVMVHTLVLNECVW